MHPKVFCLFDTETTGLDTSTCEVIEMACKLVDEKRDSTVSKSWLIKPESWGANPHLPEKITEITGITDAMVEADGMDERAAWQEFFSMRNNLPLVGHNIARYDLPIVYRYADKHGIPFMDSMELWVDTAALYKFSKMRNYPRPDARGHMHWATGVLNHVVPGLKYNLSLACEELGIDVSDLTAHRAAGDVEMCHRLFKKLTATH